MASHPASVRATMQAWNQELSSMDRIRMIYNLYGYRGGAMAGSVFDKDGLSPTLTNLSGGVTGCR